MHIGPIELVFGAEDDHGNDCDNKHCDVHNEFDVWVVVVNGVSLVSKFVPHEEPAYDDVNGVNSGVEGLVE